MLLASAGFPTAWHSERNVKIPMKELKVNYRDVRTVPST